MAEKKDLYGILGVARDADRETIRKAYRKLARENHPDLNPGDEAAEERFEQVAKAGEVLEDAERRRGYDEFGDVSLEAGFDAEKARQAREAFEARFGLGGQPGAGGLSTTRRLDNLVPVISFRDIRGRQQVKPAPGTIS